MNWWSNLHLILISHRINIEFPYWKYLYYCWWQLIITLDIETVSHSRPGSYKLLCFWMCWANSLFIHLFKFFPKKAGALCLHNFLVSQQQLGIYDDRLYPVATWWLVAVQRASLTISNLKLRFPSLWQWSTWLLDTKLYKADLIRTFVSV